MSCAVMSHVSPFLGYGLSLVLGIAIGAGLGAVGWTRSPLLIALGDPSARSPSESAAPGPPDAGSQTASSAKPSSPRATVAWDFAAIVSLMLFFLPPVGCLADARAARSSLLALAAIYGLAVDRDGPVDASGHGAVAAAGHDRETAFVRRWRC